MRTKHLRCLLGLWTGAALLAVTACELDVVPNRDSIEETSAIHGQVIVPEGLLGDVILTRYGCDNPPPPAGTGRPIDFIIVPRIEFNKGKADFIFPSIPAPAEGEAPICHILSGFMDSDHDWSPFYGVTGQVTKGDVEATQVVFETQPPDDTGRVPLVEDLQIYIENEIVNDRPSWTIELIGYADGASYLPFEPPEGESTPLEIQLGKQLDTEDPYDVYVGMMDLNPIDTEICTHDEPMFEIVFGPDLDGNGLPDDLNGDGQFDINWPRVLFLKLDTEDENLLTTVTPTLVIPGVVIPLNPVDLGDTDAFLFTQYQAQGYEFNGTDRMSWHHFAFVIPELVVYDLATSSLDVLTNAEEYGLENPAGIYQVLVMNPSGQVWSTPNELAAFGVEGQDTVLTVLP